MELEAIENGACPADSKVAQALQFRKSFDRLKMPGPLQKGLALFERRSEAGVDSMVSVSFKVGYLKLVTWQCVHFTTDSAGVVIEAITDWPNREQVKDWPSVHTCQIQARDAVSLIDNVAQGLQFPSYFGRNWNAMADCLQDLSWLQFQSLALIVDNANLLWRSAIVDVGMFVGLWMAAAEQWAKEGKPFHLVFCI